MTDDWVSLWLTAGYVTPNGIWVTADHPMPCALSVYRIWCNFGCDGTGIDVAADVIRTADQLTLGRFRDDHYAPPSGMPTSGHSADWPASDGPRLEAGELITTSLYALGKPNQRVFIAIELIGRRLSPSH